MMVAGHRQANFNPRETTCRQLCCINKLDIPPYPTTDTLSNLSDLNFIGWTHSLVKQPEKPIKTWLAIFGGVQDGQH